MPCCRAAKATTTAASREGGNGNPPAGDLKAGQVQIKGYADDYSKKISFYATAKKLTIDWGDGTIDDIVPNGNGREFSHEYENATIFQTISINTEDLTEIRFVYNYGDIYELRFGACPKLKEIGGLANGYLNKLTVFEINRAESLEQLNIYGTDLAELNLNGCINLKSLNCYWNDKLTSLDVSGCTKLEILDCSYNRLTSLDVSKCTNLKTLECYEERQLSSLNASGCTKLEILDCSYNQLTSLDLSKCTNLTSLFCSNNQLSATALNSLFTGLPVRTAADYVWIYCGNNPGSESCNPSIAENKGWNVSNNW
ncbi:MAG: leucine-rich repeat domain-containing protein [Prevotellaceae bacterium]|nr:leucine-rich repeat domain-containing protein [Prevotellaceae bacterium]